MALRKILQIEGKAYVESPTKGRVSIGDQKASVNAYCKIIKIEGNKESGMATMQIVADQYRVEETFLVPFSVTDGAPNFIKQAYEHIKTLPEWADATDC